MKVLLTGAKGQLGCELESCKPEGIELVSYGSKELDICDKPQLLAAIEGLKPDLIINAAAYTAVDKAESDREKAYKVNVLGVQNLIEAAKNFNIRLIHISTDFVFDGSATKPYDEEAAVNPIGYYGETKLLGEKAIKEQLPGQHVIIRTAWLYSSYGQNFVKTMLRLMVEKDKLSIVSDQLGTPTYALGLAKVIWQCCQKKGLNGLFHWSDAGETSWHGFALAIQEEAFERNLLEKKIPVLPIPTSEFPTPARRPAFSVMDKSKISKALNIEPRPWRENLQEMLDKFGANLNE